MGFSVRLKGHDSWLDPESAGILGWKLGKRLADRIAGREGRFITLTYDRSRYVDAQDCFDQARSRKHVSRFMRKLGGLLGVDLRGKWLCKLEFQREGWVHWHIVLVDVGKIPRDKFSELFALWGRGSINVKPLTEQNALYLMKYIAKDGDIPGWIYDYPARSVKVVRPSAGFWTDEKAARAREVTRRCGKRVRERGDFVEPVGYAMKVDRALIRNEDGRLYSIVCPREVLLRALRNHCRSEPELTATWRHYPDESSRVIAAVVAECQAASIAAAKRTECSPREAQPNGNGPRPLFLRGTGKRARWWAVFVDGCWEYLSPAALAGKWASWWAENAPWWVKLDWEQDGRSRTPEALAESWYRSPERLAWAGA
jgi:hypothetical protein